MFAKVITKGGEEHESGIIAETSIPPDQNFGVPGVAPHNLDQ